ncbi:hypothetical protein [Roseofilum casamattae]|uniref:Uncharacterized protein n=1 Tax=Roseofilum casamattae BLCC-M143 TaxID=3022442 RepID=A0ABT7BVU2_9CYAN|nr:hypothetical protein [Roseofilum casamattae]MDJ1183311.1 hypothetical protein [Roseofilum casamattae BLCC-M143]
MSVRRRQLKHRNRNARNCRKYKWCFTFMIIILIEIPQVLAAWVTLCDRMAG